MNRTLRNSEHRRGNVKGALTLVVAAAILLAGCGQISSAAQPTATAIPPTSTPQPTATAEPKAEPVVSENIVYYEPPGQEARTLSIRYPDTGEAPYPWVLVTRCLECINRRYDPFVTELLSRGYAVVQLSTVGGGEDSFCAWAWLEANSSDYDLDIDRAIAFSHGMGIVATTLGLADESLWTEWLQGCPSPAPSPVHIAGVATYSAWFLVPDESLTWAAGTVASSMGVSRDTILDLAEILQGLPLEAWRTSDLLDDEMRAIARQIPLYYAHGPKPAEQMPPFLIMHGEIDTMIPISESQAMADALSGAGLSVETLWLPDSTFMDITSSVGSVPEQIAEALDAFAQEAFSSE